MKGGGLAYINIYIYTYTYVCVCSPMRAAPGDFQGQVGMPGDAAVAGAFLIAGRVQLGRARTARGSAWRTSAFTLQSLAQDTILEQILPYSHLLMTDSVSKARAEAVCLTRAIFALGPRKVC